MNDSIHDLLLWFWVAVIFGSILWWAFLFLQVGIMGAYELVGMIRRLSRSDRNKEPPHLKGH